MALRCVKLFRLIRSASTVSRNFATSHVQTDLSNKQREYRTENNIIYYEDADAFGTLSRSSNKELINLEDEGDIEEDERLKNIPVNSQKKTIMQYADIIKQYLKHKRIKEALNVLEVRMIQEDKVKPENYIYNILIGACADVGYTKKAFKLFNEMKRRALTPTGDTYTCLFHACSNSPWPSDGLENAKKLRNLMIEKGIEPNLTNYNSMIKAFGRCGDLATAFQIVDEMISKKIKIRVQTFNHLLQACISDKNNGLRHALIVWRKMLRMREKPNIYSFNLMLKCVKDCNLGTKEDILEMLGIIQEQIQLEQARAKPALLESSKPLLTNSQELSNELSTSSRNTRALPTDKVQQEEKINYPLSTATDLTTNCIHIINKPKNIENMRQVPNLLSKVLQMQEVMSLQEVETVQDKFAIVGGQDDFLKEMEVYSVKPDIKTFTQMLPLLDNNTEAETQLLDTMKKLDIKADIDFYNMLIKKRCLRLDYDAANEVKNIINSESKWRKKKYPMNKKHIFKPNVMTYGVLAMACKTRKNAEELLEEMRENHFKVNIEILGTLLRQGTTNSNFGYVIHIMKTVKEESIPVNQIFLKHLEDFNEKCLRIMRPDEHGKINCTEVFIKSFEVFSKVYTDWLKMINVEEVLKSEHPWAQYNDTYPETVQRQDFTIKEPKRFYKRNRKFVQYKKMI